MHGRNYNAFAGLYRKETELQQRFRGKRTVAAPGQLDGERPPSRALAALTLREWHVGLKYHPRGPAESTSRVRFTSRKLYNGGLASPPNRQREPYCGIR